MPDASNAPIPESLRTHLADYPELIKEIEDSVRHTLRDPAQSVPLFEQVVWAIKDTLSDIYVRLAEKADEAEARGDTAEITAAEKVLHRIGEASLQQFWLTDPVLKAYT